MAFLEVSDLTHCYSQGTPFKTDAIKGVSFKAERGEIIAVIGHTGSGKSTLVQHLNGLLKPDSGSVLIDGKDIWADDKKLKEVRFKVGMVFQYPEHQLFDETVFDDIAYGPKNMKLSEDEVKQRVEYAVTTTDFPENLLNNSPFELSGGEMRRAAIAGVIAMKPQILVLDEPTAGLDPSGRQNIMSQILKYRKDANATVILVSHNMEDVAEIADKVLVMNEGSVYKFDTPRKVFSDKEGLNKIGLSLPQITEITLKLKNNGININPALTVSEAVREISEFARGRKIAE